MLTRFDLHVLGRFAAATALLLALLAATFVTLDYVEYVDDFLDRGATMGQVFGTYYLRYLPGIVQLTSPLAVFLAAIYVTARLAQSMQLTALHASGVSLWRYGRPLVGAAALFSVAMWAFNGWVVPPSTAVVHAFQNEYYRDAPESTAGSEIYRQAAPGVVLGLGYYDRDQARAFRVQLVSVDTAGGQALGARLDASSMEYLDSLGVWRLSGVVERTFAGGRERFREVAELDTTLALSPADLAQSERDAERLTIPEARAYVATLERSGVQERGQPLVIYYAKYAYPVANLVLVLIALPLASKRRKGGQAVQLGLGLGVAVLYLSLQKTIEPLGYVETLPPLVAVWLPHVVFASVAVVLLVRAGR